MLRQVDAVFEDGVLRPLAPLSLSERQRVRLTLDDRPLSEANASISGQQNFRRAEMMWLAEQAGSYAGQWVALSGSRLIAHGLDAAAVRETARLMGG